MQGDARILSPWEVAVDGRTLTARSIIIASGAGPGCRPSPGSIRWITSPRTRSGSCGRRRRTLLVVGGGPIGCELAQAFARLGAGDSGHHAARILPREDTEVSDLLSAALESQGMTAYGLRAAAVRA